MSDLKDKLTLSLIECRLDRMRRDAEMIESDIGLVSELRQLNPLCTPILDLRRSARSLRLAAQKLDQMAEAAETSEVLPTL